MKVGILQMQLLIPGCRSLKEKRGVIRSLKARCRNRFNIAIAEVDDHDHWEIATLGLATVAVDVPTCEGILRKFLEFAETYRSAELGEYQIEIL